MRLWFLLTLALASLGAVTSQSAPQETDPPWREILGPAQGDWPTPVASVEWESDVDAAFARAREEGRPLFVTMRCIPCQQCSAFDAAVLEGGLLLDDLLRRFVTVRLTDTRDLDLRRFPVDGFQDLDLSWWGWFLSPQGHVYGIYGGRDHVSDATRISVPSLATTMERVLDHHADPRRPSWAIDGPPAPTQGAPLTPPQLAGYDTWLEEHPWSKKAECLHCHELSDVLRQPSVDAGTFEKSRDFDVWPLPENVGIVVDRDHGLEITEVFPESPAAQAGLAAGDVLLAAGERRLFGQADFRGVLHRLGRAPARLPLWWRRDGELLTGELALSGDWRATDLGWRKSVAEASVGAHPGMGWAHGVPARDRRRLGIPDDAMAVRPYFGKQKRGPAWDAGLRGSHVVTAVNGKRPAVADRAFMVWMRLNHEPGEEVVLEVLEPDGGTREIRYALPTK